MINLLYIFILPLFIPGLINRIKAIMVGRKGQSLFQQYQHFFKLLRKDEVISHTASFITRIAPLLAFSATLVAALMVPFGVGKAVLGFKGDFVLLFYLLAFAKGIMVLAALDSGSSFEGMGASREISFTAFLEPAFVLIVASLVFINGFFSLAEILEIHFIKGHEIWSLILGILTVIALYIMLLVESSRVPFDDPATHLELTMIHEVMVLDFSGFSLALIHFSSALKTLIYASLIVHIIIPEAVCCAQVLYLVGILLVGVFTGILESLIARFRMNRNLELVFVPVAISILIFALLIARSLGAW